MLLISVCLSLSGSRAHEPMSWISWYRHSGFVVGYYPVIRAEFFDSGHFFIIYQAEDRLRVFGGSISNVAVAKFGVS